MREKIKRNSFIIICIVVIAIMTIWMWPNFKREFKQPWLDKWERQML